MKKINCAVIGMGVGERHARFYKKFPNTQLLKIYEKNKTKIKKLRKKFPKVEFVKNENEIIQDRKINLVSIASYDNYHAEQIIKCLKYKKNIFVEKPLCLNLQELKKIYRYYKKSKSKISCNLVLRGSTQFKKIKFFAQNNKFGKIYYIEADYNYGRAHKILYGWRSKIPFYSVTCGGGVHMIDQINCILNEYPYEIKSDANKIVSKNSLFKYKDLTVAILKYKSGILSKVSSNFGCKVPHHHQFRVFKTKSSIFFGLNGIEFFKSDKKNSKPINMKNKFTEEQKNIVLKDFVKNLIERKKSKLLDFESIKNCTLICLAIEKSFRTNKNVKINYKRLQLT